MMNVFDSPEKTLSDKALSDKNLPEFIRARRRLIGSLALLIVLIVGLPFLIDTTPAPPKEVTIEVLKPVLPPMAPTPPKNNTLNTSPPTKDSKKVPVMPKQNTNVN